MFARLYGCPNRDPKLGRSVGPLKKYDFLFFLTRARGVPEAPSVGLPGASLALPKHAETNTNWHTKSRNLKVLIKRSNESGEQFS